MRGMHWSKVPKGDHVGLQQHSTKAADSRETHMLFVQVKPPSDVRDVMLDKVFVVRLGSIPHYTGLQGRLRLQQLSSEVVCSKQLRQGTMLAGSPFPLPHCDCDAADAGFYMPEPANNYGMSLF